MAVSDHVRRDPAVPIKLLRCNAFWPYKERPSGIAGDIDVRGIYALFYAPDTEGLFEKMPLLSRDFVIRAKLPAGKREQYIRDNRLAGFMLRLRRNADGTLSKIYMVDWQDGEKRPRRAIGSASAYHADKAREEARRMLQAARAGEDPSAERARNRARPKFEDLVERIHEGER